jgi:hypothetical protein
MMILNTTADLIDAIANRGLIPYAYSGRFMYGQKCVACDLDRGSDLEGLPKEGATVDQMGLGYVVYWPRAEWDDSVQEYADTIYDPSGQTE